MSRIIAYDLCRLFIGPSSATPRGIDRVDLAMANHIFADPDSPHIGILPTPLGVRAYPARIVRLLLTHVQRMWQESLECEDDPRLQGLIADMRSPGGQPGHSRPNGAAGLTRSESIRRSFALLRHTSVRPGRSAAKSVPFNAIYMNLGQLALAVPMFFKWLQNRPDVTCAMMIHDTIPLDHPELVKPGSVAHHARMVRTAAAHADCLIFSTAFARASVNKALAGLQHSPLPSIVRSLPVTSAFADAQDSLPELAGKHYFVVVSTIEPRKNFALLLNVWRQLIAEMGNQAPYLVIVGAPGLDAERILAPVADSSGLRERVLHVSGLSSPALARLVLGCAALLSPSFAEGFGLPLLEGIAMGVPTIASDIPSHREIAHSTTRLLGVDDHAGWRRAILATPRIAVGRRPHIPFAMTEAAYCADLLAFLRSVMPKSHAARTGARYKVR